MKVPHFRLVLVSVAAFFFGFSGSVARAEEDPLTKSILGEWKKHSNNYLVVIMPNGKGSVGGAKGMSWKWLNKTDRKFEVRQKNPDAVMEFTLADDGKTAPGKFVDKERLGQPMTLIRVGPPIPPGPKFGIGLQR